MEYQTIDCTIMNIVRLTDKGTHDCVAIKPVSAARTVPLASNQLTDDLDLTHDDLP